MPRKKKLDLKQVVDTDRLSFTLTRRINRELALDASVNFTRALDLLSDDLIVSARFYIECNFVDEVEVKYPDGWWQALRERWLPQWMQARWPVRYASVKMRAAVYDDRIGNVLLGRGYKTLVVATTTPKETGANESPRSS